MPERLEARISRSGPAGGSRGNHPSGREGPRGPPLASATPARRHRLRVPAAPTHFAAACGHPCLLQAPSREAASCHRNRRWAPRCSIALAFSRQRQVCPFAAPGHTEHRLCVALPTPVQAVDRRERLRRLALETIDLSKDPYFMRNHLGQYECRLCLTLHTNEGNYLAHTQGACPCAVCVQCCPVQMAACISLCRRR